VVCKNCKMVYFKQDEGKYKWYISIWKIYLDV
jgi:hypothetical protein